MNPRISFLLAAVLLVIAGCGSDDADTTTTTVPDADTTTTTTESTTTTEDATTTTAPATTSTTTTTTEAPGPPAPLDLTTLEQGGTYWGLYVFAAETLSGPPAWVAFVNTGNYLGLAGVSPPESHYSFGELACDPPAATALGLEPSWLTISMYFETEAEANAAAAVFPGTPPLGVVQIELFCAD